MATWTGFLLRTAACGVAKTRAAHAIEYFAAQCLAVKEISKDSPLAVPVLPPGSAEPEWATGAR